MPWNRQQNKLFCARCNGGKGPADMCKMCHEGVKEGERKPARKTDWKKERDKMR